MSLDANTQASPSRHPVWVRWTHWVAASSILALGVTGFVILMAHPRLYWGQAGNDLTPAILELPISRNYQHDGWVAKTPFFERAGAPISASRTFPTFNKNNWGRSLHFLAGWLLVVTGVAYLAMGVITGHLRRRVVPGGADLTPAQVAEDLRRHVRFAVRRNAGSPYGTLQKWAYSTVLFVLLPLAVLTGVTMSPAVTASVPLLLTIFGGHQSARTIHFVVWAALTGFLVVHLLMVVATGFGRQMRAMTIGDRS